VSSFFALWLTDVVVTTIRVGKCACFVPYRRPNKDKGKMLTKFSLYFLRYTHEPLLLNLRASIEVEFWLRFKCSLLFFLSFNYMSKHQFLKMNVSHSMHSRYHKLRHYISSPIDLLLIHYVLWMIAKDFLVLEWMAGSKSLVTYALLQLSRLLSSERF